ncbi:protein of unknown function [Taphrina deformans PYCC 5710]|uniref:Lysophospholipase n=1 Tax=Taphrina deformans (strain PYCC 5710 / ATCC 11124 / CBS 356.35 / IMI 108563 / JCM 9778 / NBRC 8474) TaxID=1097556 RepID=R4XDP0_TAPDE|nr:protein of unknown function [Taphrina deformans PYCC 5710]|eukprot:CCG83732.1 protein of unknown function [Taphrina deformans PYCC 5710]
MVQVTSAVLGGLLAAVAQAQTSYVPVNVTCPSTLIREANTISPDELTYLTSRAPQVQAALRTFLNSANITGLNVSSLFANQTTIPRAAFAASGGGLRAMTVGGSIFNALDSRSQVGTLGGILQGCQYMAGLSGGSWLIGSSAVNNFATIPQLVASHWDIDNVFSAPQGGIINTVEYYTDIVEQVQDKSDDFFTSITDYWGRVISYHLLNNTNGDPSTQWSDIANTTSFVNHSMPFPLVVADGRAPGMAIATDNATVYEFNPFEFGSWDEQVYSFTPTRYLGSNLNNGQPVDGSTCVTGYDNAGFTMGTSSSLFNGALTSISGTSSGILTSILTRVLTSIDRNDDDIAFYPNPFRGLPNVAQNISNSGNLTLTDGWPLIQPERQVDVIFAVDASADTSYNWPNGSSLVQTYQRVTGAGGVQRSNKSISFPHIPDTQTFVNQGLNLRPTFFGCNGTNGTLAGTPPPLIIYIPNAPYSFYSNFTTYEGEYSNADINGILNNGLNIITGGNSTAYTTCIACAMIQRGLERGNLTQPAACAQCFSEFCWDGTRNSTAPSNAKLAPALMGSQVIAGAGAGSTATMSAATASGTSGTKSAANRVSGAISITGTVVLALGTMIGASFM